MEKRRDDLVYLARVSARKPLKAVYIDRMLLYKERSVPSIKRVKHQSCQIMYPVIIVFG